MSFGSTSDSVRSLDPELREGSPVAVSAALGGKGVQFLESFVPGDLIYGLSQYRDELIDLLKKERPSYFKEDGKKRREMIMQDLNNPWISRQVQDIIFLFQKLADSSYSEDQKKWMASIALFLTYTNQVHHYKSRPGYWDREDMKVIPLLKNGCKYGLLWAMESDPDKKIHFVIEGFDLTSCFKKSYNAYTNSELRFIYRNWETFKPFYESGRFNFYHKNEEGVYVQVPPPWISDPSITLGYAPKSLVGERKSFLARPAESTEDLLDNLAEVIVECSTSKVEHALFRLLVSLQSEIQSAHYKPLLDFMGDVAKVFSENSRIGGDIPATSSKNWFHGAACSV